jgi:hypothetical protein
VDSRTNDDAIGPGKNRFGRVAVPLTHFAISHRKIDPRRPDHLLLADSDAQLLQFFWARTVSNESEDAGMRCAFSNDFSGVGWMKQIPSTGHLSQQENAPASTNVRPRGLQPIDDIGATDEVGRDQIRPRPNIVDAGHLRTADFPNIGKFPVFKDEEIRFMGDFAEPRPRFRRPIVNKVNVGFERSYVWSNGFDEVKQPRHRVSISR